MYVAPDTNLRFIRNCPLAQNLDHTILFDSREAQTAYFTGITEYTRDKYSFQRRQPGVIRVDLPYESCIYFNYMCYQNHAHANKWFYAFVTGCEYINEGCTAIYFTLDVLQTWMFDWELGSCFVERETTPTDKIGDYILPEGLETGNPVISSQTTQMFDYYWLIGSTAKLTDETFPDVPLNASVYDRHAVSYEIFACTNTNSVNNILGALETKGKITAVKFLYPVPSAFVTLAGEASSLGVYEVSVNSVDANLGSITRANDFEGYEPKNNKMYTYPYMFGRLVSTSGDATAYRFEYSATPGIRLTAETSILPQSTIRAYPLGYDNFPNNRMESVLLNAAPLGAFNYDVYADWFARNANKENETGHILKRNFMVAVTEAGVSAIMTAASAVDNGGSSDTTFQSMQGTLSAVKQVLSARDAIYMKGAAWRDMQMLPPTTATLGSGSDINLAKGFCGYLLQSMTIRKEYAKTIDDYFTRFGYKVMINEVPTLNNRSNWDYIKTLDCDLAGQIPIADLEEIKAKFQNGITFWHNTATFGDYSQTNTPIG